MSNKAMMYLFLFTGIIFLNGLLWSDIDGAVRALMLLFLCFCFFAVGSFYGGKHD